MLSLEPLVEITLRTPLSLWPIYLLLLTGMGVAGFVFYKRFYYLNKQEKQWQIAQEGYRNFIRLIGHEVRQPLQNIQAHLDNIAALQTDDNGAWLQRYTIINSEILRLKRLTDRLKLLALLETPEASLVRGPVNLEAVIQDVIMSLYENAEERKVKLEYTYDSESKLRVLGDRDRLHQVFVNLVDNGIRYAKSDGGNVRISVSKKTERLHIRVIDDGVGIAAEDLPVIFEAAYRAPNSYSFRHGGSGLGLTITKRIVEQHGSTLQVYSKLNEGSEFAFDLSIANSSTK